MFEVVKSFSSIDDRILDAIIDYKFLLNRGYNRARALRIVEERYKLNPIERMFLFRSVYSEREIVERLSKRVSLRELKGKILLVDGFNVLITIQSALDEDPLIICDDLFVRDLSSAFRRIKIDDKMYNALTVFLEEVKKIIPYIKEIMIFYDAPVSRSGVFAQYSRRKLNEMGFKGTAVAVKRTDRAVLDMEGIISSSDSFIISKATKIVDLGGVVALRKAGLKKNIINVRRLIEEGLKRIDTKDFAKRIKEII
ncbi:MAG: DUF434 domain-containing protein [Thermoproteales archaeon]|nr:DUF434 domain-containing protein [Thermoproteales archaeon]